MEIVKVSKINKKLHKYVKQETKKQTWHYNLGESGIVTP